AEGGLTIYDLSNPAAPALVYQSPLTDNTADVAWTNTLSGPAILMSNVTAGLRVVGVTNANAPNELGALNLSGAAYGLVVSSTRSYLTPFYSGLRVLDISNPQTPAAVATLDVPGEAVIDVAVRGAYAYVADYAGQALRIDSLSNPVSPTVMASVPLSGSPR